MCTIFGVWDYSVNPGTIDEELWTDPEWKVYNDGSPTILDSPFYSFSVSHLDNIALLSNSDFLAEDGWRLFGGYVGRNNIVSQGIIHIALYNKYTGTLRVFVLKPDSDLSTSLILEVSSDGNSGVFSLGEYNSDLNGISNLSHEVTPNKCFSVKVDASSSGWFYIDVPTLYDSNTLPTEKFYLTLKRVVTSTFDGEIDFVSSQTYVPSSPNNNVEGVIEFGKNMYNSYKSGQDQHDDIMSILQKISNSESSMWESNILNEEHEEYVQNIATRFLNDNNFINKIISLVPYGTVVYDMYNFFSSNSGKYVTTGLDLHGSFSGSITTNYNYSPASYYIVGQETKVMPRLYNDDLGVFNLASNIELTGRKFVYGGYHIGTTAKIETISSPSFISNTSLPIEDTDIYVAVEFDCKQASNNVLSWFNDFIPGTWSDYKQRYNYLGSYNLDGETYFRYRTGYMAPDEATGLCITAPLLERASLRVLAYTNFSEGPDNLALTGVKYHLPIDITGVGSNPYSELDMQNSESIIFDRAYFDDHTININKRYIIDAGSEVEYNNCTLNMCDIGWSGFKIIEGTLIFDNSTINSFDRIELSGENSTVVFRNCTLTLTEDDLLSINSGSVIFENSELIVNGDIELLNSGSLRFVDCNTQNFNSAIKFTTSSSITASTEGYWYDQAQGTTPPQNYGIDGYAPGDVITINNSSVDFLCTFNSLGRWDGFYISNDSEVDFKTDISNLKVIDVSDNSIIIMTPLVNNSVLAITDINQLRVFDSQLYLNKIEYKYNQSGILVDNSVGEINRSVIKNNGYYGITANYANIGSFVGLKIRGCNISENYGDGIRVRGSLLTLGVHDGYEFMGRNNIIGNTGFGIFDLGVGESNISGTTIEDNGKSELIAQCMFWPIFHPTETLGLNVIDDSEYILGTSHVLDEYFVMALGADSGPRPSLENVDISTNPTNYHRYFPDYYIFDFSRPEDNSLIARKYYAGIEYMKGGFYETSYDTLKAIVSDHPISVYADKSLILLPMLLKAFNGDKDELLNYYSYLVDEDIKTSLLESEILLHVTQKDYELAVDKLEYLIENPPIDRSAQIYELDLAYCNYYNYIKGSQKNIPKYVTSPDQFNSYVEGIYSKIKDENSEEGSDNYVENIVDVSQEIYPNPFNPTTTISFSIPEESNVEVSVYNIRGQKVKTLVNNKVAKGWHKVQWNGLNSSNEHVSSGIYFSIIKTEYGSNTQKLVLLK